MGALSTAHPRPRIGVGGEFGLARLPTGEKRARQVHLQRGPGAHQQRVANARRMRGMGCNSGLYQPWNKNAESRKAGLIEEDTLLCCLDTRQFAAQSHKGCGVWGGASWRVPGATTRPEKVGRKTFVAVAARCAEGRDERTLNRVSNVRTVRHNAARPVYTPRGLPMKCTAIRPCRARLQRTSDPGATAASRNVKNHAGYG